MKTNITITIDTDIFTELIMLRKRKNIKISTLINRLTKEYLATLNRPL